MDKSCHVDVVNVIFYYNELLDFIDTHESVEIVNMKYFCEVP